MYLQSAVYSEVQFKYQWLKLLIYYKLGVINSLVQHGVNK